MSEILLDTLEMNQKKYKILDFDSPQLLFHPKYFGVTPKYRWFFCPNGYTCDYSIIDGMLMIKNLYVDTYDDNTNLLGPIYPTNKKISQPFKNSFEDIYTRINYTGRMLIARKRIKKMGTFISFPPSWAYDEVIILHFENGLLLAVEDRSRDAKSLRKELEGCDQ